MFLKQYNLIIWYMIIINLITFLLFAIDKRKAIKKRSRIRVRTLLGFCFIGGSIGGMTAMYLFRHKTKKLVFTIGVSVMMIMQIAVFLCFINI